MIRLRCTLMCLLLFCSFSWGQNNPQELEKFRLVQTTGVVTAGSPNGGTLSQFGTPFLADNDEIFAGNSYEQQYGANGSFVYQRIGLNGFINLSPVILFNSESNPCGPALPYWQCYYQNRVVGIDTSPSGEYSYYSYIRRAFGSQGGGAVVLYRLNSGPLLENVIFDFNAQGYPDLFAPIKVNDSGAVVMAINLGNGSKEIMLVDKLGNRQSLLVTNRVISNSGLALSLNNLNTVFVSFISDTQADLNEIYALTKSGNDPTVIKKVGESIFPQLAPLTSFRATNIQTPQTPEGLLYYQKNFQQIARSDETIVLDVSNQPLQSLRGFAVNDSGSLAWIQADGLNSKVGLYAESQKLFETGNTLSGQVVYSMFYPQLNKSGFVSVVIFDNLGKGSIVVNTNPTVKKLCKIEEITGRPVPHFNQADSQWNGINDFYAGGPDKMQKWGCATSSIAMVMNYYGLTSLSGDITNPGTLNKDMYSHKRTDKDKGIGYNPQEQAYFPGVAELMRDAYVNKCRLNEPVNLCQNRSSSIISYKSQIETYDPFDEVIVEDNICKGNPVILKMRKKNGGIHFLVATGYALTNGKKTIRVHNSGRKDPEGLNRLLSDPEINDPYPDIIGYRIYRPEGDPAMNFIYSSINTSLIVTDPLGRKTGYDAINQISYKEIPKAQYSVESTNTPGEPEYIQETLVEQVHYSNMESVENGAYQISLYGVETGPYSITVYSHDKDGFRNDSHLFQGQIAKGEVKFLKFQQTDQSLPIFNSILNINYAFYLDPKGMKKDINTDRIVITGKFSSQVRLTDKMKITIGGISGYSKTLLASDFKSIMTRKETYYHLKAKKEVNAVISSSGNFWIHLKDIDLDLIEKNKWGDIIVEVDSFKGQSVIQLKCVGRLCYKK